MKHRWTYILPLLLTLVWAGMAMACPMCKDAIPNSDADNAAGLPGGFNLSIYYMLGSLFAVLAGFGWFVTRTIRSTDRAQAHRASGDANLG